MVGIFCIGESSALDQIVQKKIFTIDEFTLVSGKKPPDVKVGYETYGKLNTKGDNAILYMAGLYGKFTYGREVFKRGQASGLLGQDNRPWKNF